MKKLLLSTLTFFAITLQAQAQDFSRPQTTSPVSSEAIQQGNWLVGASIGHIGYNFSSDLFSLDVNPRAGFFLSDNAVVGAQVQLGATVGSGDNQYRYGLIPFARYYFPEGASPTHRWFGEAVLGIAGSTQPGDAGTIVSRVYGVSAGYAHFVTSSVALEGMLNLIRSNANVDVGNSETGLSVSLGLQIYLPSRANQRARE